MDNSIALATSSIYTGGSGSLTTGRENTTICKQRIMSSSIQKMGANGTNALWRNGGICPKV